MPARRLCSLVRPPPSTLQSFQCISTICHINQIQSSPRTVCQYHLETSLPRISLGRRPTFSPAVPSSLSLHPNFRCRLRSSPHPHLDRLPPRTWTEGGRRHTPTTGQPSRQMPSQAPPTRQCPAPGGSLWLPHQHQDCRYLQPTPCSASSGRSRARLKSWWSSPSPPPHSTARGCSVSGRTLT